MMTSATRGGPAAVVVKFATPIYLVAFLCIVAPPLDQLLSLRSLEVNNVMWRFGAVGLLTGGVVFPLFGLLVALLTAVVCEQRWAHRVFTAIGVIAVLLLTVAVGLFALDGLQIRGTIRPEALRRFDVTVVKAIIQQFAQLIALVVLLRAAMRARRPQQKPADDPAAALVMARPRQHVPGDS